MNGTSYESLAGLSSASFLVAQRVDQTDTPQMWGNTGTAGHYGQLRVHSSTLVGCTLICCRDREVLSCVEGLPRLSYTRDLD